MDLPSLGPTSVSICMPYISKSYTHHTRAPDLGPGEKKKQGMYVLLLIHIIRTLQAEARTILLFRSTSVSICMPYISKSYTHHTRAQDLGPEEKKKQGMYVLLLIHIIRTLQAEARTSLLLGLHLSQYVCPIYSNHIRTIRGLQT